MTPRRVAGGVARPPAGYEPTGDGIALRQGRRRAPAKTEVHDWVTLSGISHEARTLYNLLRMHVSREREDDIVTTTTLTLAVMMGYSRGDKLLPFRRELEEIGAIVVIKGGLFNRVAYDVHELPPPGYKGPKSLTDWYRVHKPLIKLKRQAEAAEREGREVLAEARRQVMARQGCPLCGAEAGVKCWALDKQGQRVTPAKSCATHPERMHAAGQPCGGKKCQPCATGTLPATAAAANANAQPGTGSDLRKLESVPPVSGELEPPERGELEPPVSGAVVPPERGAVVHPVSGRKPSRRFSEPPGNRTSSFSRSSTAAPPSWAGEPEQEGEIPNPNPNPGRGGAAVPRQPQPADPDPAAGLRPDERALYDELMELRPLWCPVTLAEVLADPRIRHRRDRALVRRAFLLGAADVGEAGREGTYTPNRMLSNACPHWAKAERQLAAERAAPAAPAAPQPLRRGYGPPCLRPDCDSVTRERINPSNGNPLPGRPICPRCHPDSLVTADLP